jgi:hypothetical protein
MIAVQTRVRITTGPLADLEGVLLEVTPNWLAVIEPDSARGVRVVIGFHQLGVIAAST